LQPDLNLSRRQYRGGDFAEVGVAQARIRVGEMRVVEGVEEFRSELNRPLFADSETFEKRQVEVNHTGPTRVALAGVTEGELRGRSETASVEPSIDGLGQADVGACQVGVIAGGRVQLRSREGDHERRAAADVGDSVDLPATDDEIRHARN